MRYGIANEAGQIDPQGAKDILDLAIANDVNTLDTAIAYGNSDEILGECSLESLKIITKIPTIPKDCFAVYDWVISEVQTTLKRLNQDSVYGILLHDTDVLFSKHSSEIIRALEETNVDKYIVSYEPFFETLSCIDLVITEFTTSIGFPVLYKIPTILIYTPLLDSIYSQWSLLKDLYGTMKYFTDDINKLSNNIQRALDDKEYLSEEYDNFRNFFEDGAIDKAINRTNFLLSVKGK